MSIKVQCPQCRTVSAAPDGHAGRFVRCKRCNTKFLIPQGLPTLPVSAVGEAVTRSRRIAHRHRPLRGARTARVGVLRLRLPGV